MFLFLTLFLTYKILKLPHLQVVVSSRVVAERFGKEHKTVLRAIENKITSFKENNLAQNCAQYFVLSNYKDDSGKSNKEYLLTRDGFTFIMSISHTFSLYTLVHVFQVRLYPNHDCRWL